MSSKLRDKLGTLLGSAVERASPVGGGSINDVLRVETRDGRTLLVKTHASPPPRMYELEARGLSFLREARALRIPEVVCVAPADGDGPACLVLEFIQSARQAARYDEALGRGLAALHRHGAPGFGLDHDNYIATLPQVNTPAPTWAAFYRERRLLPQLELAMRARRAPASLAHKLNALCAVLEERVGPAEPPARVHGDLWSGNCIVGDHGEPVLIDPAAHGGHREVDLSMMRLFGGFSERTFAAYAEAYPLAPEHEARVPLYQLYFLLVHVNLFGGQYVASTERVLDELL